MKDFANEYSYRRKFYWDEELKKSYYVDSPLRAWRNNRLYNTKMKSSDLPEHYCDVQRSCECRDVINTKGVKHILYKWVPENHFMKDSILYVSYGEEMEVKPFTWFDDNGVKHESRFTDVTNVDTHVFGTEIFKFLAYIKKYSNFDLSKVRETFIEQCEWLKENEPPFAPDADDFGEWFDNKISEYI